MADRLESILPTSEFPAKPSWAATQNLSLPALVQLAVEWLAQLQALPAPLEAVSNEHLLHVGPAFWARQYHQVLSAPFRQRR
jgi:hypothetical protein